jgi:isoleucyl-tRNA synthetase
LKALEEARSEKKIGKSLEASVAITTKADYEFLKSIENDLAEIFIVSCVSVSEGEDNITIAAAEGEKCERCWTVSKSVGTVSAHPTICARCAANLE